MTPGTQGTFYGWWVVAASFLILLVTVGIGLYAPPVFLVPLQEHFGWSRAAIAGGGALAALTSGAVSPLVGVWIDRYGARKVMVTGALVMGLAFGLLSLVRSIWHLYALNVIAALGVASVAWIPNQTLVSNWFARQRGMAMGIALAGIGFGGLCMAPLAGLLIARVGWRGAYAGLGSLVLVLVVAVVLAIVRNRPADLGLAPDGRGAARARSDAGGQPEADGEAPGLPLPAAVRSRAFWILCATHLLWTFGSMSVIGHVAAFLVDQGFESSVAAGALGLAIGVSVVGRLSFGLLSDRLAKKSILSLALVLHALAVVCLFRVQALGALPGFVILFGLGVGGGAVLMPLLVGECFGLPAFARILGLIMIPATVGAALGPVLTGRIFDVTGSYQLAFLLLVGSFVVGAVTVSFLRPPRWETG